MPDSNPPSQDLVLAAQAPGQGGKTPDSTIAPGTIEGAAGVDLTLTVTNKSKMSAFQLMDSNDVDLKATFAPASGVKSEASFKIDDRAPISVHVVATIDGEPHSSHPLEITASKPASKVDPSSEDDAPAEIKVGQYDPLFSVVSGSVFAALAACVVLAASWSLTWVLPLNGGAERTGAEAVTFGTWDQRVIGATYVFAVAVGAIAILAGCWMAVMEVRGRQRAQVRARAAQALADRDGVPSTPATAAVSVVDSLTKLATELKKVRGTIATLIIGAVLILVPATTGGILAVVSNSSTQSSTTDTGK